VNADLAHCNLSVHIFGEQRGFIPDEEDESILLLQYRMACERGVERITFSPAGTSIHPAIATVLSGDAGPGIDRIEDKTLDRLLEALEERIRRRRSDTPRVEQQTPNLYVICDDSRLGVGTGSSDLPEREVRGVAAHPSCGRATTAAAGSSRGAEAQRRRAVVLGSRRRRMVPQKSLGALECADEAAQSFLPAVCVSSPPVREREQYRRPDLRFEQVDELRCDSLRTLVSSLLQTPR
jgi:hypothetical protein